MQHFDLLCNILIYFCNIYIKHLQHASETSKTLEMYFCNMRFQRKSPCCFSEWRLVGAWSPPCRARQQRGAGRQHTEGGVRAAVAQRARVGATAVTQRVGVGVAAM